MGFFVVCVLKEAKTIISDKIVKVLLTDCCQFHNVFNIATNNQFENLGGIQVFLRKPPEKWVYVEEGLQSDISMLFELNFTHIKFILEATETTVQKRPNAFDLIMNISQRICLPEQKKEDTRKDLLYNNIIKLFQNQYQKDQNYNLYYFTGKHAKYNLEHDKLEKLASSLELSAAQP
ncbi:uncharacterized protein OCT59_012925 [Rhizophagus irregularis]|uniref:uncharacterized protein n=1 Tax=Rhizophagus irregularis TaxID=588596 RepID=UPI00331FF0C1|nr:hypothetical protein OCT59_012925 [Rhizophagus irregularis]